MKKLILLFINYFIFLSASNSQPSFSWGARSSENQKIPGPCHIFGSVSAVETWYKILYGQEVNISQAHVYSPCAGNDPVTPTIFNSLNFFKNAGVVTSDFLPYTNTGPCHASDYYSYSLYAGNPANTSVDCGTPWSNCTYNSSLPSERYRIADFSELPISSYTDNNQLKRAIMNYGPIIVSFHTPSLYNNQYHTYCLEGWDANGDWRLTDSHETFSLGFRHSSVNILSIFQQNSDSKAYIIKNTASKPAVYRQTRQAGPPNNIWDDNLNAGCIENWSTYFQLTGSLSGASPSINNTTPVAIGIEGLQYLDNETVDWSYESIPGYTYGAVSFTPSTGASTTVSMVLPGKVKIKATIRWPNGICATLTTAIIDVMSYDIVKTHDWCINTYPPKKEIQYQISSATSNMQLIGLVYPSSNFTTTQSSVGNTFTFTITPVPAGFGMNLTVKAPNGATIGSHTIGGSTGGCYGYRMMVKDPIVKDKDLFLADAIQILPNPVSKELSIDINDNESYAVKIFDIPGRLFITSSMVRHSKIDVTSLPNGVYIIHLINSRKKNIITRKFIKE